MPSLLGGEPAIQVNVEIMRAPVRPRNLRRTHVNLARKWDETEQEYDDQSDVVFNAIRTPMKPPASGRGKPGGCLTEIGDTS